jgi:hypothetical protein
MFVPNDVTYTEIVTHVEKHMYIYTGSGTTKQHYVIKFVIDLRQVDGFLRVLYFPPPIKLTAMI